MARIARFMETLTPALSAHSRGGWERPTTPPAGLPEAPAISRDRATVELLVALTSLAGKLEQLIDRHIAELNRP